MADIEAMKCMTSTHVPRDQVTFKSTDRESEGTTNRTPRIILHGLGVSESASHGEARCQFFGWCASQKNPSLDNLIRRHWELLVVACLLQHFFVGVKSDKSLRHRSRRNHKRGATVNGRASCHSGTWHRKIPRELFQQMFAASVLQITWLFIGIRKSSISVELCCVWCMRFAK